MTEEVKVETNQQPQIIRVGEMRIQMGEKAIVFRPTDDITPKEVALTFQMFLNGLMAGSAVVDFGTYIVEQNLGRHFQELKDEASDVQDVEVKESTE